MMAHFLCRAARSVRYLQGMPRLSGFDSNMLTRVNSLHRYLTDVARVDIYWYIGSRLDLAPADLPPVCNPITGSSTVPWRYHFNTGWNPLQLRSELPANAC